MLVSASVPTGVHAGLFSSVIASLSATFEYKTNVVEYNSQTIPLPKAAYNIDPNPSKGGGDTIIVDDSALMPSSGPSGTLVDVGEDIKHKNNGQISIYIVREGDTLSGIGQLFDVSVNTIRWANDIGRTGTIRPGQELVILPVTGIKYTIKNGGTLQDVVDKYGGDIDEVADYNNLRSDEYLAAGTEVIIPSGELSEPKATVRVAQQRYSDSSVSSSGTPSYAGYYMRPIVGGTKTQGIHGYNGVDLAAPSGTPILASANGRVILSKSGSWNGGYGDYVVIEHDNGTQTLYAHNSKNLVFSGQNVVQGQVIGYVGSTGRSTGPHVHFEVRGAANPF
jgi:murein DD-endopeptidase MepM/ murein hydrolase activator NlpD